MTRSAPAVEHVETTEPSSRRVLQMVLVLGALIALGPLSIDMYLPAFPEITGDLAASESQVQLTLTGMLLGLALGQLFIGPLSDAFGRKAPLAVGLAVHGAASVVCAVAPTIEVLAGVRLVQGFAGAAVTVTAMAMVRDQFDGVAVARVMSRLMLVMGAAPLLAPTMGSLVLAWTSWRGIFAVLALVASLLVLLSVFALRETLPPARRRPARIRASLTTYRSLLRDRAFLALALMGGLMFSAMFSYISGSSFVFQDGFGLSEGEFALAFGLNAAALIGMAQVNPFLLKRFRTMDVVTSGVLVALVSSLALVLTGLTGLGGIAGAIVPLVLVLGSLGVITPNVPALALNRHGEAAGSAAAVLGFLQYGVGGALAPLVGAFGVATTAPLGAVMAGAIAVALLLLVLVVRRDAQVRVFA